MWWLLPCYSVRASCVAFGARVPTNARTRRAPPPSTTGGTPMRDPRNATLARVIIRHSTRLEPGEAILIESFDLNTGLVLDLVDAAFDAKGVPIVYLRSNAVNRSLMRRGTERQFKIQSDIELFQMKQVQAYVGLRSADNSSELADVPGDKTALHSKLVAHPVHLDYRVNQTN